jgi:hypothetical protein
MALDHTYPAPQADGLIYFYFIPILVIFIGSRFSRGNHFNGIDSTGFGTFAAAGAFLFIRFNDKRRSYDNIGIPKAADSQEHIAAAFAAVTDELAIIGEGL